MTTAPRTGFIRAGNIIAASIQPTGRRPTLARTSDHRSRKQHYQASSAMAVNAAPDGAFDLCRWRWLAAATGRRRWMSDGERLGDLCDPLCDHVAADRAHELSVA